jgi:hypothetical protein
LIAHHLNNKKTDDAKTIICSKRFYSIGVWGASLRSRLPLTFIVFSSKSAIANILSLHLLTDSQDDVFFKH